MKNVFKSKRNILIMMFALVVIMGIGFAAYSQQLQINDTSSIDSNWDVYIKSVDVKNKSTSATGNWAVDETTKLKAELTTDLKYPGDNVIYNITVANDGSIDAILEKINFSMEKENTVIKYYYSVDDEATWNEVTKSGENPYNVDLLTNTTDEFQVKVEYDPTKTGTATEDQKSNKLTLNLDYAQKTGGGVIPSNPITADDLKEKVVTTGDGLYSDTTESGRYIYKGTSPNNYISFNNEIWRIMSVESDNTIKIIRNESIGTIAWDKEGTRDSTTSTYCTSASTYGCSAWAATSNLVNTPSVFTLYNPNGNPSIDTTTYSGTVIQDASLNTHLNGAYLETINDDKQYIVNHNFNIGTPGTTDDAEDIVIDVSQEALYKWNGKVGLMNVTDVLKTTTNTTCTSLYAGTSNGGKNCNTNNWMWTKTGSEWTISPYVFWSRTRVWTVLSSNGCVDSNYASHNSYAVRPVLYLSSDISLDGEGTSGSPYTIVSR